MKVRGVCSFLSMLALAGVALSIAPASGRGQGAGPKAEELTPEEIKERDARKGCKIAICSAFHVRKPGADIGCEVTKTWRKEQITKLASKGGVNWVWGPARCTANINLKRDALAAALAKGDFEMKLAPHSASCEIMRDKEAPYVMKVAFAPTVTFKAGKAVKAAVNWGDIDAPALVKGALWTLTTADNKLGVLGGSIVEDINDFIHTKCIEVKSEWQQ